MVLDWEHHLSTKKFAEMVKGTEAYLTQLKIAEQYPIDVQLRDMDAAGIDTAVLTGAPRWNLEECRLFNDEIATWVEAYPDRFIGFAHVPPLSEAGLEELDRSVKDLGFRGCMFRSNIDFKMLDFPSLYPFYEKVMALDIPLFIHPAYYPLCPFALSDELQNEVREYHLPGGVGEKRVREYNMFSGLWRELDLMLAIVKLIDGGVLAKFPNLKIVMSHLGGGISSVLPRLYGTGGRDKESRKAAEKALKYFSRIYFNTAGNRGDIDAVKCALIKISPKRIIFATDCPPWAQMKNPNEIKCFIEEIKKLDISDAEKQLILEGNAKTLLKI